MPTSSDYSSSIPASVLRRWILKAFLLGLFLGTVAGLSALVNQ